MDAITNDEIKNDQWNEVEHLREVKTLAIVMLVADWNYRKHANPSQQDREAWQNARKELINLLELDGIVP